MALPGYSLAGPQGGTVSAGSATISQSGATTTINQSSNRAIINWQGFSIGASETVNFNQPGITAATLNRVTGNDSSVINGALNATGQVFIVNQNGVLFGKGAQVNVGGLTASTLNITDSNFMAGNYTFQGRSAASVVNQGKIKASDGGYVALLGKTVSNDGVIVAKMGTVAMASGEKVTLNFDGNSLIDVTIDEGALNALVENKKAIKADGGKVILTAKAADDILSAQVNNSGVIQARTMSDLMGGAGKSTKTARKGSIKLLAQGGAVNVSGKLDASAPKGGDGGFIETSGDTVNVSDSAVVTTAAAAGKTGTWLIDPNDFTIAAFGGNMTGTAVANALANNNFEIATATQGTPGGNGDIFVNDVIAWNSASTLTLNAERNINVNAVLTAPNGGLALNAGTDININAPSSLQVATVTATAHDLAVNAASTAGDINFNAVQNFSAAGGNWTFNGVNINVNDAVNWSAGTLTLNAGFNGSTPGVNPGTGYINLNAPMTASGAANLVVTYNTGIDLTTSPIDVSVASADLQQLGLSFSDLGSSTGGVATSSPTAGTPFGGINPLFDPATGTYTGRINFTRSDINSLPTANLTTSPLIINGNPYVLITSIGDSTNPHDLSVINANGGVGFYALATALTAPATAFTNSPVTQIASGSVFEGLGNDIRGLTIATGTPLGTTPPNGIALIGQNAGTVRDVSLTDVSVTAGTNKGDGTDTNGATGVGALVGSNTLPLVDPSNPFSGLDTTLPAPLIINAAASGSVSVFNHGAVITNSVGGLVGNSNAGGIIYGGWADVHVTALNVLTVGGLVGASQGTGDSSTPSGLAQVEAHPNIIRNSVSVGPVDLTIDSDSANPRGVGGLVGSVLSYGALINDFSSSVVTLTVNSPSSGIANVGGLVGTLRVADLAFATSIINSNSAGRIVISPASARTDGVTTVGGLAGESDSDGAGLGAVILNSHTSTQVPAGNSQFGQVLGDGSDFGNLLAGLLGDPAIAAFSQGNTFNPNLAPTPNPGAQGNTSPPPPFGSDPNLSLTVPGTATGPSPTQGPPPSNAQQAANARAQAQQQAQQATAQQVAFGQAVTSVSAANGASAAALKRASTPPSGADSAAGTRAAGGSPASAAVSASLAAVQDSVQSDDRRRVQRRPRTASAAPAAPRRRPALGGSIRELQITPAKPAQ